jgi:hypothetical protein
MNVTANDTIFLNINELSFAPDNSGQAVPL